MEKHVVVVNTAAKYGGALTILKQFIEAISKYSDKNTKFHIFVSADLEQYNKDNIDIVVVPNGNSYCNRVFKEKGYIKSWCKSRGIKVDLIISLQNIGVKLFKNVPQIIYLHQPLPFRPDLKWSLLKRDEARFWFYQNIYKQLIKSWTNKSKFIVQTSWMKEALVKDFKMDEGKIYLIRPNVGKINSNDIAIKAMKKDVINMFYPTSSVKYKNYALLFKVMQKLNKEKLKYNLYITLERDLVEKHIEGSPEEIGIMCLGQQDYKDVLEYYKSVDLVLFPSYLETFGLPLIEATQFAKPVIAADLAYAVEVLDNYKGAIFADHTDVDQWVKKIREVTLGEYTYRENITEIDGWEKMFQVIDDEIIMRNKGDI